MVKYYRDCNGKVLCRHRGGSDQFYLGQGGVERIRFKKDFIEEIFVWAEFYKWIGFPSRGTYKQKGRRHEQAGKDSIGLGFEEE